MQCQVDVVCYDWGGRAKPNSHHPYVPPAQVTPPSLDESKRSTMNAFLK
jgi:hypothetical protein